MAPSPDRETPTEPQAGYRDAETGFDEETPLIARESAGPPTRAVAAGGVLAHPRTWTWQRWVTYVAALVIVLIFTLTIIFGGTASYTPLMPGVLRLILVSAPSVSISQDGVSHRALPHPSLHPRSVRDTLQPFSELPECRSLRQF